jgi:hypothetical protein
MKLFKRINVTSGDFIEDCLFESHPYLFETVLQPVTDEDGITTQQPVLKYVTTTVLVDSVDEAGVVTLAEQEQPVLDPQYIETEVPQGFYWPKWNGTEWVEGGFAPAPVEPEPTIDERLDSLEDVMLFLI